MSPRFWRLDHEYSIRAQLSTAAGGRSGVKGAPRKADHVRAGPCKDRLSGLSLERARQADIRTVRIHRFWRPCRGGQVASCLTRLWVFAGESRSSGTYGNSIDRRSIQGANRPAAAEPDAAKPAATLCGTVTGEEQRMAHPSPERTRPGLVGDARNPNAIRESSPVCRPWCEGKRTLPSDFRAAPASLGSTAGFLPRDCVSVRLPDVPRATKRRMCATNI